MQEDREFGASQGYEKMSRTLNVTQIYFRLMLCEAT